ncbi:HPF/RaiA family ribosome-associated protein [Teredinibacter purpureus]|uniref:HPF/RaiA family ribosome-associated protein n=1 Tax=Teredinibacter purpureus TaxID=2731756 RepID=UPI0006964EBA|nr:HPF/RaiA family ribosome-associated protein [Teredinibacter purpureus]
MKLSIKFRKVVGNGTLTNYINRRISFAFSRTEHAIHSTAVTVSDINGPKGGIDKECLVVIKPAGMAEIVVSERQPNFRQAIDRCIARANQSLARKLKRNRLSVHKRHSIKRLPVGGNDDTTIAGDGYEGLEPSY